MKTKEKILIGIMILAAWVLLPLFLIGCPGPMDTPETPIDETTLSMRDGVSIVVKYSYLPSSGAPAWLDEMQTRFNTMSAAPSGVSFECINALIAAGGEFIIQVEDSANGFQKVDSTTLSVGKD